MQKLFTLPILLLFLSACGEKNAEENLTLNQIADRYVRLSLVIGEYESDYIDAYYGPDSFKPTPLTEDKKREFPSDELIWKIHGLIQKLEDIDNSKFSDLEKAHQKFLIKQLIAAKTKVAQIAGTPLSFDEESLLLYDAVAPQHDSTYFEELLNELDAVLPGQGTIQERYLAFTRNFVIPKDKLDAVFKAAIAEARKRTLLHLQLPANENFELEYVTNKSWSGYNWYKGNSHSVIQINTDFPIMIERVIDLASHEGYPGHHVYNVLLEENLVKDKKWVDFSVYPLFSPQSLIAEGSANFGIEMVFPGEERTNFEKRVIYPLAGLDSSKASLYNKIQKLKSKLEYAGNEAARDYLDGKISRQEAADWLEKYDLYTPERALQRTRFFDKYRSYVINYNLGKDLVKNYVERKADGDDAKRWQAFGEILSSPKTASMLR